MSLPSVNVVRERIEQVRREDIKVCLMAGYLFAARISELVGRKCPSDKGTTARGPKGTSAITDLFELGPIREEAVIFKIATAKRGGIERNIALPVNEEYEPWSQTIYDYFQKFGKNHVFPVTRQKVWQDSKETFGGLRYPIERYKITRKDLGIVKVVDRHLRPFRTHALRHIRATELIEYYGFDGIDLSIYGGWTLRSTIGVGSAMQRYAHLQWRKYFPKLLKKRR